MEDSPKGLSIRLILTLLIPIILVLSVIYKAFEWSALKQMTVFASDATRQEISMLYEQEQLEDRTSQLLDETHKDKDISHEQSIDKFDELLGIENLKKKNKEEYLKTLEINKKKLDSIGSKKSLLLGKKRQFLNSYYNSHSAYYQSQIELGKESNIRSSLMLNYLNNLKEDAIMRDFFNRYEKKSNEELYANFPELITLEKYTKADFKYIDEEEIKISYPYGYETLIKYKNLFSSMYTVLKDYGTGNKDSADYKTPKLYEAVTNISVDFDKFRNEYKDKAKSKTESALQNRIQTIMLAKKFNEEMLGKYPFLKTTSFQREDLALCYLYAVKTSYYKTISNNYPKAQGAKELIDNLNELPPKTVDIDNKITADAIGISINDKEIMFECKDAIDGKVFKFKIQKAD
ncbi:MAG: hypothetical protein COU81_01790 [Candidatus Portnoybacteria bacterium CG10_big_fil_rev_8_21_14_0_10_36_7]|uniref:Uncharacterized protein n=1 Tax=Candidatus Portnoybacteria bacterium CG10_big_fil_rev_8_21_14_0_10_36_7 TaxID=1974812 RepID=A0A2M8KEA2_9BACT|nr:MAG: hypothetical protein COU81_01790 [Candidatus Portnoybacteria bacterium CG10_big_fil_rev_8_21_14_0_10_36_7]